MKWRGLTLALLIACLTFTAGSEQGWQGMKSLPRLPGARLLVGYPPGTLAVTGPENTWMVAEGTQYLSIYPSLSRDGNLVAATRVKDIYPMYAAPPMAIATYSLSEHKWTEYMTQYEHVQDFEGSIAIAPDGSKLAFAVADPRVSPRPHMHVIELTSGAERRFPINGRNSPIQASWSPDGREIVYDSYPKTNSEGAIIDFSHELFILNLKTGESRKIANGRSPAWSPSGEWICHLGPYDADRAAYGISKIMLVRPDGTGSRLLRKEKYVGSGPVWSPDSKSILVSRRRDIDKRTEDVKVLNIATRKVTRIVKGGPPVFGWAEAK